MHLLITGLSFGPGYAGWGSSLVGGGCAVLQCGVMQCGLGTGQVEASQQPAAAGPQFEGTKKPRRLSSPHLTTHNQTSVSPCDNVGAIHAGPQLDQSALTVCHCQLSDVWGCSRLELDCLGFQFLHFPQGQKVREMCFSFYDYMEVLLLSRVAHHHVGCLG